MSAPGPAQATAIRCPACGQPIETPETGRCPLCKFTIEVVGDERVTGNDVTPYAKAYNAGQPGWWKMCRWVWLAGTERLKHLALMRSSPASRTFALHTSLLLALGLAIYQGTRVGWTFVRGSVELQTGAIAKPVGRGWLHAAGLPRPLPPGFHTDTVVDVWWNPAQAMIGGVIAGLSGLVLLWTLRRLVGAGIAWSHQRTYRGEQRMSAALLYGAAWGIPAVVGAFLCLLRPFAFVGPVARWSWPPSDHSVRMIAGAIAALSALFWWIWLIRLGAAAPHATRTRVMSFFLVGAPLLVGGVAVGWWYGLEWLHERLFFQLNMHF